MSELETTAAPRRNFAPVALSLTLLAVIGVAFATQQSSEPDSVATVDDVSTTTTTTTTATSLAPVFVEASSSQTAPEVAASTTTKKTTTTSTTSTTTTTTTTTIAPTTTVAPTTVPETLPQPIAPPSDPRAFEEQNQIGRIVIPKIGVDWPLLEGIRMSTLDRAPGHWPGTAMPGQVGNVVVAGHRTSHGGPFRNLDDLSVGDKVSFTTSTGVIDYTVTGTQIVGPDALWITNPTSTPTATLFACHPPGSTRQRIVVNLALS